MYWRIWLQPALSFLKFQFWIKFRTQKKFNINRSQNVWHLQNLKIFTIMVGQKLLKIVYGTSKSFGSSHYQILVIFPKTWSCKINSNNYYFVHFLSSRQDCVHWKISFLRNSDNYGHFWHRDFVLLARTLYTPAYCDWRNRGPDFRKLTLWLTKLMGQLWEINNTKFFKKEEHFHCFWKVPMFKFVFQ